jgi:hypothetical protein
MHIQRKCSSCRATVQPGARACGRCGSREGSYIARYRGPDGVERSKSFGKKAAAQRHLIAQNEAKRTGEWIDPERSSITLAAFWEEQRTRPGVRGVPAPTTLAKWDTIWSRYLRDGLGTTPSTKSLGSRSGIS